MRPPTSVSSAPGKGFKHGNVVGFRAWFFVNNGGASGEGRGGGGRGDDYGVCG